MSSSKQRIKIGEKVANIDMTKFDKRGSEVSSEPADGKAAEVRRHTGVGMVMGAIAGKSDLERKLSDTQKHLEAANNKLAVYDGADLVRKLDPATIRRSRWANRDEQNFTGPHWDAFKDEIKGAGGNVEPIKVRRVSYPKTPTTPVSNPLECELEIVFGHRRHKACLELGLLVSAVVVESMDDRELFAEMDRENRERQNLSAWEQGRMYNHALREGLYPSIRQLCEDLGVNLSNVSRSCKLAQLPEDVVLAFSSPMVIQVRWAKPLSDALQRDPEGMLERARALHAERSKLTPIEVMERLLGQTACEPPTLIAIHANGMQAASLRVGSKGRAVVEFEAGALEPAKHEALVKLIADFLDS